MLHMVSPERLLLPWCVCVHAICVCMLCTCVSFSNPGGHDPSWRGLRPVELYDPLADSWTWGPMLPMALPFAGAGVPTKGQVYVIGGGASIRVWEVVQRQRCCLRCCLLVLHA